MAAGVTDVLLVALVDWTTRIDFAAWSLARARHCASTYGEYDVRPQPPHERKQEGDDHESGDDADEAGASAMRAFFQSSLQSAKPLMVSGTVQSVDQTQQLPPLPSGGSLAASLLS